MTEHWNFYPLDLVDAGPASVMLDLNLGDEAPLDGFPWLLSVDVAMRAPASTGLASREEVESLGALEDELAEMLELTAAAHFVGRMTHEGRRHYFFYAAHREGLEDAAIGVLSLFPDYGATAEYEIEHDPDWSHYLEYLYPDPFDEERMHNRQLVLTLQARGDRLGIERPVHHRAFFPDEASRQAFVDEATGRFDFELERLERGDDEDFPFAAHIVRQDRVELEHIDEVVGGLWEIAEDCGGYYGGWNAKIVRLPDAGAAPDAR
jgi:hypothetical protein